MEQIEFRKKRGEFIVPRWHICVSLKQETVMSLLNKDDNNYYDQPTTTNQANVMFKMPTTGKTARTVILHSKGWYERIINPTGAPDKRFMSQYPIPGSFNQLTYDFLSQAGQSLMRPGKK